MWSIVFLLNCFPKSPSQEASRKIAALLSLLYDASNEFLHCQERLRVAHVNSNIDVMWEILNRNFDRLCKLDANKFLFCDDLSSSSATQEQKDGVAKYRNVLQTYENVSLSEAAFEEKLANELGFHKTRLHAILHSLRDLGVSYSPKEIGYNA
jgi:hypothetical protein